MNTRTLPQDYEQRVYAGVLGKIIGVYVGQPFEGWPYDRISSELGEINYYVNERFNKPLVVADDDISGTFCFIRALEDYNCDPDITPQQIGQTWMNYLIEKQTVLWWGGMGNSTEHTAYLRMKHGIMPPLSGAIETNGQVVAEQIGAQIFIDGWAMVAPGNPQFAADLARKAGSVSHDGEAIHGAQVIAAIESMAFIESDIDKLIDAGLSVIPKDCLIAKVISDVRTWARELGDWRKVRQLIEDNYGYDKYGGNCHMVPNHALIILALLCGEGDFQKTMMIVNTCGWDTDCNAANIGCIMGIRNGLKGLDEGPDWRGPFGDRIYIPTSDGGRCVTDAAREAMYIANLGRRLAGQVPIHHKNGVRYSFVLPGSVHGFLPEDAPDRRNTSRVSNDNGKLLVECIGLAPGRPARVETPTHTSGENTGYAIPSSPSIYSGQVIRTSIEADKSNQGALPIRPYLKVLNENEAEFVAGPIVMLEPGQEQILEWTVPDTEGFPILSVGIEAIHGGPRNAAYRVDWFTWDGPPSAQLGACKTGKVGTRAWTSNLSGYWGGDCYTCIQDEGLGMAIQGSADWTDITIEAKLKPHMVTSMGLAIRVQGLKRYYGLQFVKNGIRLVRELDGTTVLAEKPFDWSFGRQYAVRLVAKGSKIEAIIDGIAAISAIDEKLPRGAVGILCEEGRMYVSDVWVKPTNDE